VQVVVGAVLVRDGQVLAAQRTYPPELAGRWELPGGGVEAGEDEPTALVRECREELGVSVAVGGRFGPEVPLGGHRVLRVYVCTTDDEPTAREHAALRWVGPTELDALEWLPADRVLLDGVIGIEDELRRRAPSSRPS
jgi:8-oxo-dGTP diphosphatase